MRRFLAFLVPVLVVVALGCSGKGDSPQDIFGEDSTSDSQDTLDARDAEMDSGDVLDVDVDLGDLPDNSGDELGDDLEVPFECPSDLDWPSADDGTKKFGLTMFHWNIQYVAGGLEGSWENETISICKDMFGDHDMCVGWTDEVLLDWIIEVSFQPILDLYLKHPDWRATFEIPGLMIEVMKDRHPEVLEKLRCVANNGQIELVSFHWSDQLFLAFPARDLEWSIDYNREIFKQADLPLSKVVFNQEGQSGVGKHRIMATKGYTIDVMHKNLYKYHQQGEVEKGVWPVYESTGPGASQPVKVVVSGPVDPAAEINVEWTFFDDGEVLATPLNPYLAPSQPEPDWSEVRKFERKLQELADQGYIHTTITDYIERLNKLGITPKPLLPIADSTWQPPSTDGISRWMGKMGILAYSLHENDNLIRTMNYEASTCLAAVDLLAQIAEGEGHDVTAARQLLKTGYLHLMKAQVSDATGINPWRGEWIYGFENNEGALTACNEAKTTLLAVLNKSPVVVDLDERKLADSMRPQFQLRETDPADVPFNLEITSPGRTVTASWADDGKLYLLELAIGASDDPSGQDRAKRTVSIKIPLAGGLLKYSPALVEDAIVEIPLADFDLLEKQIFLPLSNGLIGLGPDLWLIKSCRDVHIAARVESDTGDFIEFTDETVPPEGGVTWRFYIFDGQAETALYLARALNTHPHVLLSNIE